MGVISLAGICCVIAGFGGVITCLVRALRIRSSKGDEATRRAALARLVSLNAFSMGLSAIGAMIFIIGLLLTRI